MKGEGTSRGQPRPEIRTKSTPSSVSGGFVMEIQGGVKDEALGFLSAQECWLCQSWSGREGKMQLCFYLSSHQDSFSGCFPGPFFLA